MSRWFDVGGDEDGRYGDLSPFGVSGTVGVDNRFMSVGPGGESSIQHQARAAARSGDPAQIAAANDGIAAMTQNASEQGKCILVGDDGIPIHMVDCPPDAFPGQHITAAQAEASIAQGAASAMNRPAPSGGGFIASGPTPTTAPGSSDPGPAKASVLSGGAKAFLIGSAIVVGAYAVMGKHRKGRGARAR